MHKANQKRHTRARDTRGRSPHVHAQGSRGGGLVAELHRGVYVYVWGETEGGGPGRLSPRVYAWGWAS